MLKGRQICLFIILSSVVMLTMLSVPQAFTLPVIPETLGFGMETPAGRGGRIIRVTNLNASGNGSFRAALNAKGPRVVVFEVSGTIVYNGRYKIREPFITIAGQTAPSPGITLRGSTLTIDTHDVLIQHIRVRTGDGINGVDPDNRDAISIGMQKSIERPFNIVVDHCSVSWSIDEAVEILKCSRVTFRRCIISEPLAYSMHSKGEHSKALLIGQNAKNIAILENVLAHANDRNPVIQSGVKAVLVNNLIYNPGKYNIRISSARKPSQVSVVGNVIIAGKDTRRVPSKKTPAFWLDPVPGTQIYLSDNLCRTETPSSPADWSMVKNETSLSNSALKKRVQALAPPVWVKGLSAEPSSQVKTQLLANAGARPMDRDAVDQRIIDGIQTGTGRIIDTPNAVGGWPTLQENHVTLTLPDAPNGDANGDGYTNLEEWLHELATIIENRFFR